MRYQCLTLFCLSLNLWGCPQINNAQEVDPSAVSKMLVDSMDFKKAVWQSALTAAGFTEKGTLQRDVDPALRRMILQQLKSRLEKTWKSYTGRDAEILFHLGNDKSDPKLAQQLIVVCSDNQFLEALAKLTDHPRSLIVPMKFVEESRSRVLNFLVNDDFRKLSAEDWNDVMHASLAGFSKNNKLINQLNLSLGRTTVKEDAKVHAIYVRSSRRRLCRLGDSDLLYNIQFAYERDKKSPKSIQIFARVEYWDLPLGFAPDRARFLGNDEQDGQLYLSPGTRSRDVTYHVFVPKTVEETRSDSPSENTTIVGGIEGESPILKSLEQQLELMEQSLKTQAAKAANR